MIEVLVGIRDINDKDPVGAVLRIRGSADGECTLTFHDTKLRVDGLDLIAAVGAVIRNEAIKRLWQSTPRVETI